MPKPQSSTNPGLNLDGIKRGLAWMTPVGEFCALHGMTDANDLPCDRDDGPCAVLADAVTRAEEIIDALIADPALAGGVAMAVQAKKAHDARVRLPIFDVKLRMENGVDFEWRGHAEDKEHAEGQAVAEASSQTGEQVVSVTEQAGA